MRLTLALVVCSALSAGCVATAQNNSPALYLYSVDGERVAIPERCDVHLSSWIHQGDLVIACDARSRAEATTLLHAGRSDRCDGSDLVDAEIIKKRQFGMYTISDMRLTGSAESSYVRYLRADNYCAVIHGPNLDVLDLWSRAFVER